MRALFLFAAVAVVVAVGGCKPDYIPGTSVEDTKVNRKVIDFLGRYRAAVVERSPDAVVGLTTADYFEDNGTVDQGDDYGRVQLKEKLAKNFGLTKEIQLEIIIQQIEHLDDGTVKVAYRYNQRALITPPAGDKWVTVTDVNRLVLRPDDAAGYLIASGL